MARLVKEEEYNAKRNAILDVMQQLVGTTGYEQMAIQDILDALQISRGTFYHYFDSKAAVLFALVAGSCNRSIEDAGSCFVHIEAPHLFVARNERI